MLREVFRMVGMKQEVFLSMEQLLILVAVEVMVMLIIILVTIGNLGFLNWKKFMGSTLR